MEGAVGGREEVEGQNKGGGILCVVAAIAERARPSLQDCLPPGGVRVSSSALLIRQGLPVAMLLGRVDGTVGVTALPGGRYSTSRMLCRGKWGEGKGGE